MNRFCNITSPNSQNEKTFTKLDNQTYRARHNKKIMDLTAVFANTRLNPFEIGASHEGKMINIACGKVLDDVTSNSVLEAKAVGHSKRLEFYNQRLALGSTKGVYDPIKKSNTPTFNRNLSNNPRNAKNPKNTVVGNEKRSHELMRLITILGNCSPPIPMEEALKYPCQKYPACMATTAGGFYTASKSNLKDLLIKLV